MSAPPPDLEALFAAEKADVDDLDVERRARVRSRLESSVASLGGASDHLAPPGASLGRWSSGKIVGAVVAGALAGGALGHAIGYQAGVRATTNAPTTKTEPLAPVAPTPSVSVPPPPASAATAPGPSSTTPPTPSVRPSSTLPPPRDVADRDGLLAAETSLLRTARTALLRGDAAGALAVTETHRARFPEGRLVEERESIAIQSLVRLERADDARARAAAFERAFPNSIALPVIRAAVAPR